MLCYLEGAWLEPTEDIEESFPSDRHHLGARTWQVRAGEDPLLMKGVHNMTGSSRGRHICLMSRCQNATLDDWRNIRPRLITGAGGVRDRLQQVVQGQGGLL